MKIDKALEDFGLLIKGIIQTIENKAKEQRDEFLGMLLGTLSGILLGNMLVGKGVTRAGNVVRTSEQEF